MGQEKWLQGAILVWKPYPKWSLEWDHDHCAFCSEKFMNGDDVADALREGTPPRETARSDEPTTAGFVLIALATSGNSSPGRSSEARTTPGEPGYIHGRWPARGTPHTAAEAWPGLGFARVNGWRAARQGIP